MRVGIVPADCNRIAGGYRVGAERRAMHLHARQRDVQVAGRHGTRVKGDAGDEPKIVI